MYLQHKHMHTQASNIEETLGGVSMVTQSLHCGQIIRAGIVAKNLIMDMSVMTHKNVNLNAIQLIPCLSAYCQSSILLFEACDGQC